MIAHSVHDPPLGSILGPRRRFFRRPLQGLAIPSFIRFRRTPFTLRPVRRATSCMVGDAAEQGEFPCRPVWTVVAKDEILRQAQTGVVLAQPLAILLCPPPRPKRFASHLRRGPHEPGTALVVGAAHAERPPPAPDDAHADSPPMADRRRRFVPDGAGQFFINEQARV